MATPSPHQPWTHHRATLATTIRHHGPDHPAVARARRLMELARTEQVIADAIANAPPLDADTLARIRALIPPIPVAGASDAR